MGLTFKPVYAILAVLSEPQETANLCGNSAEENSTLKGEKGGHYPRFRTLFIILIGRCEHSGDNFTAFLLAHRPSSFLVQRAETRTATRSLAAQNRETLSSAPDFISEPRSRSAYLTGNRSFRVRNQYGRKNGAAKDQIQAIKTKRLKPRP